MRLTFLTAAAALALLSSPAFALKITNLDTVSHTVVLSGRGAPQMIVVAPQATEIIVGATQGFLSLNDAPAEAAKKGKSKKPTAKPATRDSVVHADGLLSGIIGNERNDAIPADPRHNYVIWPGGKLRLQSRTKQAGQY